MNFDLVSRDTVFGFGYMPNLIPSGLREKKKKKNFIAVAVNAVGKDTKEPRKKGRRDTALPDIALFRIHLTP
ncbi:hypothetical protein L3X38_030088 [Prunus dulcis]|uniref:Uncharacterized protein n=1 Tax=Prunus dulcis TaxID=3755 RepID=A0AAD4V9Z3_PRUDU|nr:hypothetical protein L3X38_030088 [Prunus dulcis]